MFLKNSSASGALRRNEDEGAVRPPFFIDWGKGWERRFFLGLSQSVKGFFYSRLYNFLHM
nr:hypothetical protein [Bacillaceae bacterium]